MTKQGKIVKKDVQTLPSMDSAFDDFRREMESMMMRPWPWPGMWHLSGEEIRMPLCDMADKGDRYELQMEVPGIEKDKIDVKATADAIEVSGRRSEEVEEKKKDYVYQERSRRSFYRKITMPDEVEPSKISAKMTNGVLVVDLPKKASAKSRQSTKVEVK
jgi:HSP20 family protein